MARRKRNYKLEYRRRKARGKRLGLSLSIARGHARAGERPRPASVSTNPHGPEESGLKMMKRGVNLKDAARANHMSQERLRRYLRESTHATRVGKVWKIVDLRRFHLPIYSRGQIIEVWLSADEASKAGEYLSAVGRFLPTGDASQLKPFVSDGVRDLTGAFHPFETGPNTLYRLDSTEELSVPEIYKIQG
ncbi:MAG TPA: hypothetical protein VMD75_05595 [Candidatus Binataceae bacterium]|nr:hypothetical protein [Candidatus Binataceae bacterium]